jgi:hypothetical protein
MAMNPRLLRPTASGHPEARAWRSAVQSEGGSVSGTTFAAVSRFCADIEAAGLRSKFRRLNLMCGNADASLVAVRTPLYRGESLGGTQYGSTRDANFNFVEGDYTEATGLLGNGTSKYLNTGFNIDNLPAASNCHMATYLRGTQDITVARAFMGNIFNGVADRYRVYAQPGAGGNYQVYGELGKAVGVVSALRLASSGGLYLLSRTSTTSLTLYDDGESLIASTASTAETTGAFPVYIYTRNGSSEFYNGLMAGYSIGAGLTANEASAYYTALNRFQTALGRAQA